MGKRLGIGYRRRKGRPVKRVLKAVTNKKRGVENISSWVPGMAVYSIRILHIADRGAVFIATNIASYL